MEWCYNCDHVREIKQLPNGRRNGWCKLKRINVDPELLCECWCQREKPSNNKVTVELELDTTKLDEQLAIATERLEAWKKLKNEIGAASISCDVGSGNDVSVVVLCSSNIISGDVFEAVTRRFPNSLVMCRCYAHPGGR